MFKQYTSKILQKQLKTQHKTKSTCVSRSTMSEHNIDTFPLTFHPRDTHTHARTHFPVDEQRTTSRELWGLLCLINGRRFHRERCLRTADSQVFAYGDLKSQTTWLPVASTVSDSYRLGFDSASQLALSDSEGLALLYSSSYLVSHSPEKKRFEKWSIQRRRWFCA